MAAGPAAVLSRHPRLATWAATAFYLGFAVFATWPLARGLGRDIASDLGDPLLNMWILTWDGEQLKALVAGHFERLPHWFDGNIFHPARLTLAYSEHLLPQALQVFPVYLITSNPILCYNLLFLSTYVLSGLGAFLLVRELTGDWRAAFLGGLLFAFAPYRLAQASHLQVLSAQWMPFALYGFTRYLETGRLRALAGGAAATVVQALSTGYYLLYFVPFAVMYVLWELGRRRRWRNRRVWLELGGAAALSALLLTPFLLPYAQVREELRLNRRPAEVETYSADVYSYFTASSIQNVWQDRLRILPRDEGELFPGAVPLCLGLLAVGWWAARAWSAGRTAPSRHGGAALLLGCGIAVCAVLATITLFERRINVEFGPFQLRVADLNRVLGWMALLAVALLAISPRARLRMRALHTLDGFFCVAIGIAWWLSLGPTPRILGRTLELFAPYSLLYDFVPGFDGVRVPARYAMIVALMLAVSAGVVAARLLTWRRVGVTLVALCTLAFLVEAVPRPFPINGGSPSPGYNPPEPRVYRPARAPGVYRRVAALDPDTVLLELPIGDPAWDLRSVYYSTVHWRKLVNGYSGFFPPSYPFAVLALTNPGRTGEASWQAIQASGVTHVIVHEAAYQGSEPAAIRSWLFAHGAHEVVREGEDVLYAVPRSSTRAL